MKELKTIENKNSLVYKTSLFNEQVYDSSLMTLENFKYSLDEVVIPSDWATEWQSTEDLILIILDGRLTVEGRLIEKNNTVIIPANKKTKILTDAIESVYALAIKSPSKKTLHKIHVIAHDKKLWNLYDENGKRVLHLKNLLMPDLTHIGIMQTNYLPGQVTEWHTHKLTHASYVLSGIFMNQSKTDQQEKYYAPGSVIVGPEGQVMRHGAPKDSHGEILFIYNDDFNINYLK